MKLYSMPIKYKILKKVIRWIKIFKRYKKSSKYVEIDIKIFREVKHGGKNKKL